MQPKRPSPRPNPCQNRLERLKRRLRRKLQPNPVVYSRYFFYKQRPEDRILRALVNKTKTIREELGSLSQVIDSRLDVVMKNGIRRRDIEALEFEIDSADLEEDRRAAVEEELEAARERQTELRGQIERLSTMLENSQQAISFSKDRDCLGVRPCVIVFKGISASRQKPPLATINEWLPGITSSRQIAWDSAPDLGIHGARRFQSIPAAGRANLRSAPRYDPRISVDFATCCSGTRLSPAFYESLDEGRADRT